MEKNHIIEFSRSEKEAKKIYFGGDFKNRMAMQILGLILFLPGCLLFAFILSTAILMVMKFEVKNNLMIYVLTLLLTGLIIYPFVIPIVRTYKQIKFQLNQIFKNRNSVHTRFLITTDNFEYQNDFFSYTSNWNNVKNGYVKNGHIQFETITPAIKFFLPLDKFELVTLDFIKEKLLIANNKKK